MDSTLYINIHRRKEINTHKFGTKRACMYSKFDGAARSNFTFFFVLCHLQFPGVLANLNNFANQQPNDDGYASVDSDVAETEDGQIEVLLITTKSLWTQLISNSIL